MASLSPNSEELNSNVPAHLEPVSPLQLVTRTLWDTVCSTTFVCGALVGAALMYVGSHWAQSYLSNETDGDQPF